MKYTLYWIDYWTHDVGEDELTEVEKENILDHFPPDSKITGSLSGCTLEIECHESFEANTDKEAVQHIYDSYDCEVWTLSREDGKIMNEDDII